ncbi:MAG: PLP-dependent aspartate aminotransferase family protein [Actinomycetota bacterium]
MPRRASLTDHSAGGRRALRPALSTRTVHPPAPPSQPGEPLAPLLDQSSTYWFADTDEFAAAAREKTGSGYVYTRWANPTLDAFAAAVADLESAPDAAVFASGMAAISCIFLGLCSAGDRVVAARQLYGGTFELTTTLLPRFGITTDLVDVHDHDAIASRLKDARFLYCETIGNPRIEVADVPELARIAAVAEVPLVVDNTFATPILCRPLEHGAAITLHSATKFLGGHHDLIGGVACAADPELLQGPRAIARELGPTLAPFNAWLALRGMQTLELRVARSCATALTLARWLEERAEVGSVSYPGLASDPSHARAGRVLGGAGGGTLGFELIGGREHAGRVQESLALVKPAASLGGTHTLLVHAASVTHTQMDAASLRRAEISEGFCRLSVGLEDPDDLIADLEQAFDRSG